ncbi:DegT/DnrJ/EryC1/StrS family aminotransferase [Roseateles oligotrophus]|uniref:DegT/DnrJ/EryC1/StrS family aminotransferase n=1 Tax=Roseateles oligotrophus TaxID=1769250 RepID=A0ABT2YIM4_9BURK|nr:DegT/DnrJ/EryC1/StrS family aminotransferase [Roseateles oligotrophus]MCV2369883.1 DegT/DnrJ/EryC1/StrS family aminotransferase [Roseateles oligotrophus]
MITKSAVNKTNYALTGHFTKSARAAWGHIIKSLSGSRRAKVLLPAYIGFTEREGSGVFDPVSENEADYCFYKINSDLSVDLADFEKQLTNDVNIILIIHYFGFCRSDIAAIKRLCSSANAILVEDCAHAFHLEASKSTLGQVGDFAFYSLHKYIATDSGGFLKTNIKTLELLPLPPEAAADIAVVAQYALTDFEAVKRVRRCNYELYAQLLAPVTQIEIMFALASDEIPQTFAIRVRNSRREALYFHLMHQGMPTTALYYRMIDEIHASEHPESHSIASEILNLPVHQDTTTEDVEKLCASIIVFFNIGA